MSRSTPIHSHCVTVSCAHLITFLKYPYPFTTISPLRQSALTADAVHDGKETRASTTPD